MSSLRIAWFSVVSSESDFSLSEYCSRLLIPELAKNHEIEVFSSTLQREAFGRPNFSYLNAFQRHRDRPFDIFFYQLEDTVAARFMRAHCGLIPGVLWAHDLFMRDLGSEGYHTSPWEQSIRQFYDTSVGFSDRSHAPHQLWPRIYRETSLSPVVLFSSQWAKHEFGNMTATRLESVAHPHRVETVPVPVADLSLNTTERECASGEEMRLAYYGMPSIEGRGHKLLPVLRSLPFAYQCSWMLPEVSVDAARRLLAEYGLEDRVVVVGSQSPTQWREIVAQSDLAFHLHSGAYGHLAPYIQISFAQGCPTAVLASGSGEDISSAHAFHIHCGMFEGEQIRGVIDKVRTVGPENLRSQCIHYAERVWSVDAVVGKLERAFCECAPHVAYVMDRWEALRRRGQRTLLKEVQGLASGMQSLPFDPYSVAFASSVRELGWEIG